MNLWNEISIIIKVSSIICNIVFDIQLIIIGFNS